MNPYLITMVVFGVLAGIVYMIVGRPSAVYLPVDEGTQEDIEARKKRGEKVRSKRWVIGMGGVMAACMLTMFGIWIVGPAKTVYGAFNPTNTPTMTLTAAPTATPTITPTRTKTATPRGSATPQPGNFLTKISSAGTLNPSGVTPIATSNTSGGASAPPVVVYRTVVVINTKIVLQMVPVTVVVTATPTFTPTVTPSASETPTVTFTPTFTPSATWTPSETPMMCIQATESGTPGTPAVFAPCTVTPTSTETAIP